VATMEGKATTEEKASQKLEDLIKEIKRTKISGENIISVLSRISDVVEDASKSLHQDQSGIREAFRIWSFALELGFNIKFIPMIRSAFEGGYKKVQENLIDYYTEVVRELRKDYL
jgi:hypothetical protein